LPSVHRRTDGGGAYLRYYSDRILATPDEELREVTALLATPGRDIIDLTLGAPRFDLVPSGSTKLPAEQRGWPPAFGLPELREAVASHMASEHSLGVNTDEVLITHGAAGAWGLVLDAFVNAGDRVVLLDPCSPLLALALRQRRARIRWLSTWMDAGRTRFRLDHLARVLRGARLLVLTSPNNPTGGVLAVDDLEQLAWWARRRDALIYADESFQRYLYEGSPVTIASLPTARPRTLIAGGVSKGHGLPGARVGWLVGPRHLVRPCGVAMSLHSLFVPTLSQYIALAALRQGSEVFEPIRSQFASRRRYAYERLRGLGLTPDWPAGAFFFWLPITPHWRNAYVFAEELQPAAKVRVTPGGLFGPSGGHHIRISYAIEDGRLREGLTRLGEFLRAPLAQPARSARDGNPSRALRAGRQTTSQRYSSRTG
jgi:aspartate/methionine/tyrosine aminotransferase